VIEVDRPSSSFCTGKSVLLLGCLDVGLAPNAVITALRSGLKPLMAWRLSLQGRDACELDRSAVFGCLVSISEAVSTAGMLWSAFGTTLPRWAIAALLGCGLRVTLNNRHHVTFSNSAVLHQADPVSLPQLRLLRWCACAS
jgi:hypothetical protein